MNNDTTQQCVLLCTLFDKPLVFMFGLPEASNDGGGMLLQAADTRLRLSERLAVSTEDSR